MRYVKAIVLLLNILRFSQASLFGDIPRLCKIKNPLVDLTPPDVVDVINFLRSQQGFLGELQNRLITEVRNIEKAFSEAKVDSEEIDLNIIELIEKYGYKAQVHEVTTEDGYRLTLQRIPGTGPAVLLMHLLLGSGDDWVTVGEKGLPFQLASEGYDVWMGNNRGNKHSKKHESLSPECADYWDFSFDENARFDLPDMIDYILDKSGQTKLAYVGVSQSSTQFLVLGSELPEYNDKISVAALLGPVAYTTHTRSPLLRIVALTANLDYKILRLLGLNSLTANELLTSTVTQLLCGNNALSKPLCSSILPLLGGYEMGQFDIMQLPVILNHYPAGGSVKQIQHFVQEVKSGGFYRFDYGKEKNKEIYGTETPPEYKVENLSAPVAIFYSRNDWVLM